MTPEQKLRADPDRRTGRTTRMLLAAAIAVSEGKDILLVGYNQGYSEQLAKDLHRILGMLGIPHEAEQVGWKSQQVTNEDSAMEIFVDHYAG